MGKKRVQQPTSSRLNVDLARTVVAGPPSEPLKIVEQAQPEAIEKQQPASPPVERLTRTRRVLFTPTESRHHEQLVETLKSETGLDTLKWSQVTRALWRLMEGEFDPLLPIEEITLKAPPSNDLDAVQQFDKELASYLYQRAIQRYGHTAV